MDAFGIMEAVLQRRPAESRRAAATNCQRPVGLTLLTQLSQEYHREASGRLAETRPWDGPGDSEASSPTLSLAESRRGGMAADEQSCVVMEDDDDDQLLSASQVVVSRRDPFSDILSHLEVVRPPVLPTEPTSSKVTTWLKKSHRYLAEPDLELDVGTEGERLQNLMIASPDGATKRPEPRRAAPTGPRFFKTRLGPDRWLALAPVTSAATDKADDDPYLFVDSQQSRNVRPPASRRSSRRGARFRRSYVRRDVARHFVCKARRDAPPRSPEACGQELVASPLKTPKDSGTQSSFVPNSVDIFDVLVAKSPLRHVCNIVRTPCRSSSTPSSDSDDFLFGTPPRRRCAHKKENIGSDTRRLSLYKCSTESKEPFKGVSGIDRRRLSSTVVPSRRSPRLSVVRNVTKEQTVIEPLVSRDAVAAKTRAVRRTKTTAAGRAKMDVLAYSGLTGIRTTPFASVAYSVGQQGADNGKSSESFASLPASQVSTVKWNNEDHPAMEGSEAGVRSSCGDRPACGGGGASVASVHHSAVAMSGGVLLGIQKGKVFGCAADLDEIAEGPVGIGSSKAGGKLSTASSERTPARDDVRPDVPSTGDGPRRSLGVECAGGSTDPPRDEVERGCRCHSSTAIAEVVFNTDDQVSTFAAATHHGTLNASPVDVVCEVSVEVLPPSSDPRTVQLDASVPKSDGAATNVQIDKIVSNDDCCPAAMTLVKLPLPVELHHGVSPPLVRFTLAGKLRQRSSVDGRTLLLIASGSRARIECPYCGSVVSCRTDRPDDGDEVVCGRAEVVSCAVQTSDSGCGSPVEQVVLPSGVEVGVETCHSAPPLSLESDDDESMIICLSATHDSDVMPAVPRSPEHPVVDVISDQRVVPSVPSPDSDVFTLDPFTLNRQVPSSVATDHGSFPMDVDSEELMLLCADATPAGVRRRCRPSTPNSGAGSVHGDALRSERVGSAPWRRDAHEEVLDTMLDVVEVSVEGRALTFGLTSVSKTGSKDAVGRQRPEHDAGEREDLSCRSKACPEDRAPSTGSPQTRKTVRGLASGRFPFIFSLDCSSLDGDLGVSGEGVCPERGGAAATSSSGRVGKLWEQSPSGGEIVVPPTPRPSSQCGADARRCLLRALDCASNASELRNGTAKRDETGRASPKNLSAPSSTTASQKRNWEAWSVDDEVDDECVVVEPKRRKFRRVVVSSSSPASDSGGEQRRAITPIRSVPMPDDGGQSPELLVEDTDSAMASSPRSSPEAGLYVPETEDAEVWSPLPSLDTFDGVLADVLTEPGVVHGSDGPDTCDLALEGAELEFGPTALRKCRAAGSWSLGDDTLDLGVSGNRRAADHRKAAVDASGGAVTAFRNSDVSGRRSDRAGVPDGAAWSAAEDRGVTGQTDEDSAAKSDTKTGVELQCSGFGLSQFSELSTDAEFLNTQAREQLKQDIDTKMASIRMLEELLKTAEIKERQQLHWSSVVSKDSSPADGGRHDWRRPSDPVAACRTVPEEPAGRSRQGDDVGGMSDVIQADR